MPGIDYRAARGLLPLAGILRLIDYQPRSRFGQQLRGPCPLHESQSLTSRVFAAHIGKNAYHSFRCKAGGNALDLWAALTGQSLHAAVIELCQRLNRPVPSLPADRANQDKTPRQSAQETTMPAP